MSKFSDDMRNRGYSKEEEYFHKKDKEALDRLRTQAAVQRTELEEKNRKKDYWMRCPKCGSNLKEETYGDVVTVDRCANAKCGGVFFDGGELEILLKAKNNNLFKRIFGA